MNIKEKRIVVTGAAGFIGSNLTDSLLEHHIEKNNWEERNIKIFF